MLDLPEVSAAPDALHHYDAVHRRAHHHAIHVGHGPVIFDFGLIAVNFSGQDLRSLRLLDELGLLHKLFVMRLGLLGRKFEFFGFDGRPHLGGLEVEQRLVPIRLGAVHQLNVSLFRGVQIRFHLLDVGVQLDHRVFVIIQPV